MEPLGTVGVEPDMNSNRNIVLVASAGAVDVLALGVYAFLSPMLAFNEATPVVTPPAKVPHPSDATVKPPTATELARLQQENDLLKQQLDNLRVELSQSKQQAVLAASAAAAAHAPEEEAELGFPVDLGQDGTDKAEKKKNKDRNRETRGNWSEERAAEFREGMNQFYDDAIASADTPEAQDRITSIRDYSQQMMDLRQQMRNAADDTTREALRADMEAMRDEMRPLIRDQQNYLLQQAAASAGVNNANVQRKLADALRDTMRSPFFMPGFGSARGGPGGGPGGPGGGRGPQ